MKKTLLIPYLFFFTMTLFGESYEGTLIYVVKIDVSSNLKTKGITKEIIINQMKEQNKWSDTIIYTYKGGNCYSTFNNGKSYSIYLAKTNEVYSFDESEPNICTVRDASIDTENKLFGKMPLAEKLDSQVIVNNTNCSIVRIKWKTGTYDYYYNSHELVVNPSLFENYIYDGWSDFFKISHSLPIRIVKETNGLMIITMTLISENTHNVSDDLFNIPELVKNENLNEIIKLPGLSVMEIKWNNTSDKRSVSE